MERRAFPESRPIPAAGGPNLIHRLPPDPGIDIRMLASGPRVASGVAPGWTQVWTPPRAPSAVNYTPRFPIWDSVRKRPAKWTRSNRSAYWYSVLSTPAPAAEAMRHGPLPAVFDYIPFPTL